MAARRDSGNGALAIDLIEKRRLVHIKTKEECRIGNDTIQVWTIEMPSKHAEGILRVIKEHVPGQDSVDLQHLRRFAKPKFLPQHLQDKYNAAREARAVPSEWVITSPSVRQAPDTSAWNVAPPAPLRNGSRSTALHLLVCPSKIITRQDLCKLLLDYPPFCSSAESWAYPLDVVAITVPLLAPTSPEQAAKWSQQYWPTFYRKTNPFGAHPASIEKAEQELQQPHSSLNLESTMLLAEEAGDDTLRRGIGAGPGCVIMERIDNQLQVVAVAGDARHQLMPNQTGYEGTAGCEGGNMMGHAVMRAIGMIARKRLRVASQPTSKAAAKAESNFASCGLDHDEKARDAFFNDLPLTPIETKYFAKDNLKPDGYLCLKLEIILTHEPCIMCSMALVHSRVGRVVFKHRMPETGGLTAEMARNDTGPVGLGYGLCWRKELNWQFMCWEYAAVTEQDTAEEECQQAVPEEKYQDAAVSQPAVYADEYTQLC